MLRTNRSKDLSAVLGYLALAKINNFTAPAQRAIADGAPPEVVSIIKAAVGTIPADEIAGDIRAATEAFIGELRSTSIFYDLLAKGSFIRAPLRTRLTAVTNGVTAYAVEEGKGKPLSRLNLTAAGLDMVKAVAMIVVTNDAVQSKSPAVQAFLHDELRKAVSQAVDGAFLDRILDTSSPTTTPAIASSGNDTDAMRHDLSQVLAVVNTKGAGPLVWIIAPDVANVLAVSPSEFPGMSPTGGTLLNLPAYVSDSAGSGTLYLLNAGSVAADSDAIVVRASEVTSVQMDDEPTQDAVTPAPSTVVSMFQTNSTVMVAEAYFGGQIVRSNALAVLTDIAWGQPST